MGGVMGVHPAAVLLAIAVGASVGGVAGMLFALPILLITKTCLRVWAARRE
jgi:predicted PurR-regulated permease PerM